LEAILRTHPGIEDVAVIGVPDAWAGELPVACVKKRQKTLSEEEIKEFLSKKVAEYKMVSRVIFVDTIPKSMTGKILRKDLRKMYSDYNKV
jgi:4-coumarate--CoA ligase